MGGHRNADAYSPFFQFSPFFRPVSGPHFEQGQRLSFILIIVL